MKVTRILLIAAIAGSTLAGCSKDAVKVTGITLNKSVTTIVAGESEQLSVTEVKPYNATEKGVTWDSDNKDRATVDETGKVSAIATATAGTVNIIATAKDGSGVTATCVVTVTEPDLFLPFKVNGEPVYVNWDDPVTGLPKEYEPDWIEYNPLHLTHIYDFNTSDSKLLTTLIPGSSAKIVDAKITLTLEKPNALYSFNSIDILKELTGVNVEANVFVLGIFYDDERYYHLHYCYLPDGKWAGNNYHDVYLIYTEEDIHITGVAKEQIIYWDVNINLNIKKGWNTAVFKRSPNIWTVDWETATPDKNFFWVLGD